MAPKRRVECATAIKAAQSVKAGAIQKVEKLGGFGASRFSIAHKMVKALAVQIEKLLVVAHLNPNLQTALHLKVKIYQVRIEIVQDRLAGLQPQRRGQSAAKRLNVPPRGM